jgi:hypothetical protein
MEVKFRIGEKVEGTHGGRVCTPRVNMPRTGVEPVKIITPFLKLVFYAGKLSDVMYVPPWAYRDSWG